MLLELLKVVIIGVVVIVGVVVVVVAVFFFFFLSDRNFIRKSQNMLQVNVIKSQE